MKTSVPNDSKILYFSLIFLLVLSVSSCSKKITFITSTEVPSAQGSVKIAKDNNDNHTIYINIQRLANPKRLSPSKKTYVVWMETDDNGTKNIGQLNSDDSFFSSTLKAEMHTTTPFKPKRIFITAEDNSNIRNPGTQVVLTTKSF